MLVNTTNKNEIDLQIKLLQLEKTAQTVVPRRVVAEQFLKFYTSLKETIQQRLIKIAGELTEKELSFEDIYNLLKREFDELFSEIEE